MLMSGGPMGMARGWSCAHRQDLSRSSKLEPILAAHASWLTERWRPFPACQTTPTREQGLVDAGSGPNAG